MQNYPESQLIHRIPGPALAGMIALAAAACGTAPPKQAAVAEPAGAEAENRARITRIEPVRPKIELTGELLFKLLLAEFAGQKGRLDISLENYLELARTTRDPRIVERATRIAVYARDDDAAATAARLWVELDPRNPDPHQVLAVMQLRAGNLDKATAHLQEIFAWSDGEMDQKLWMIANLLGREQNREAVLTVMETLISSQNDSPAALYAFSHVAARLGALERSRELLEETLALAPENDNAAFSYISILQRLEREQDAIAWAEQELRRRKGENAGLRMAYARLLMDAGQFDEARNQFEQLAAQSPENSDVLYMLGLLYLQANRLDDSALFFEKLAHQEKLIDVANYYLGRIAEEKREYAQAGALYQGVHKGEHYFDAQVRLALLLARDGKVEEAREHLNAIQPRGEQQAIILVQAEGELLMGQKRYADAIAVYDRALENKYNADLLYARAMAAEKIGRLDLLEADLRTILEREPDHVQALNALGYTLADATERYDEAYELIRKALDLSPSDFYIMDSMGWVLYRLGRLDEAIDYLRRAIKIRPDPEIAAHLGEVLWVSGAREQAREIWESALKQTPEDTHLLDVIQRFNP